jgi:hypothetical protein
MATQLFSDFPANVSTIPGMVTPNISADIQQTPMSIQDQAAAYELQKRMKEDREREWAEAAAANKARAAAATEAKYGKGYNAQGWRVYSPEEIKLRQAFDATYGPQLAQKEHDIAMTAPGREGDELRRRFGNVGQYPGGYLYSSGNVGQGKSIPLQSRGGTDFSAMLNNMWRMQTDPYLKAVGGGMDASTMMTAMTPGQIASGLFGSYTFDKSGNRIPLRTG